MKVVLGIGNPGREYENTRHNTGWRVVDMVAARAGLEHWRRRFSGLAGELTLRGEKVLLLKPETFVNLSGESAREALAYTGAGPEQLLVVADDVNLPLGVLRCRRGGSSGGHKGLESIISCLGTDAFARLRVGVGRPEGSKDLVSHVLGDFSEEEKAIARRTEERAADAVLEWINSGIEACMNRFNGPVDHAAGGEGIAQRGEEGKP